MLSIRGNTRFVENVKVAEKQNSIKIEHRLESREDGHIKREWVDIGYIHKKYSKSENKYIYTACDTMGNQLFPDIKDLHILKQAFRNNGKQLAELTQMARVVRINRTINKPVQTVNHQENQRKQDLKRIRENKNEKLRKQELKQEQKDKNLKTEKELDAKNAEKYKDNVHSKTENPAKETSHDEIQSELENQQEHVPDLVSDRMEELEDIREQDNDIEQDLELDM